jgi:hypothetical protein
LPRTASKPVTVAVTMPVLLYAGYQVSTSPPLMAASLARWPRPSSVMRMRTVPMGRRPISDVVIFPLAVMMLTPFPVSAGEMRLADVGAGRVNLPVKIP